MAYITQEQKKEIAKLLKKVVPSDWKYSLAIRHHSTIVMTIRKGPVELVTVDEKVRTHFVTNHLYLSNRYSGEMLETMEKINAALNLNNFDNSDTMTDYFDVGHYVTIQAGKWNKPFIALG